jgi:uncharacterized protein (TIGR00730 family)
MTSPQPVSSAMSSSDFEFLQNPRKRSRNLIILFRIGREMLRGMRRLHFLGPAVTIFGSARLRDGSPAYQQAREFARQLGESGFAIITGGGPGIMEAANRGARDAGAVSVGCTIVLPHEERANAYVDVAVPFHYFFVRKYILIKYSSAFVVMPGGFGTADELFEALTLIQTGKMRDFPVVLCGGDFWQPLRTQLQVMLDHQLISPHDLDLLLFTDTIDEAIAHIRDYARRGDKARRAPRPLRVLGERGTK